MKRALLLWVALGSVVLGTVTPATPAAPASNEIVIGASLPLTGQIAFFGSQAQKGIDLAVEEINESGGVRGRKLRVIVEDDRGDPKSGVSIMMKFAAVDGLPVVIGSVGSTVTLAMVPIANQHQVVLISPVSTSERLTKEGGAYFFRVIADDDAKAKRLADWVREEGHRKVAMVFTNNGWGQPVAEGFRRHFTEAGGSVVLAEGVKELTTDLRTPLAKVREAKVDALVAPTYPVEGGALMRQAKEMGLSVPVYGLEPWDSPKFLEMSSNAADGGKYLTSQFTKGARFPAFADRHRKKYQKDPDAYTTFGYDAVWAVYEACKIGATDGPAIQQALRNLSFAGASSSIAFDAHGNLKNPDFQRNVFRGSERVRLP